METRRIVFELLPNGINNIVWDYFASKSKKPFQKGLYGEYEACSYIFDRKHAAKALYGACAGGWIEIINCLMLRGLHEFSNIAMKSATKYNQVEVVRFLLKYHNYETIPKNYWDYLIKKYNLEMIKLFVKKGYSKELGNRSQQLLINAFKRRDMTTINYAFSIRNRDLHLDLYSCNAVAFEEIYKFKEMITNNTFNSTNCLEIACAHGNCEVIEILMLFKYSQDEIYRAFNVAVKRNNIEVFKLIPSMSRYHNGILLFKALKKNHREIAKILIQSKSQPQDMLYNVYKFGDTKLFQYALENNPTWQYNCSRIVLGKHDNVDTTNLLLQYLQSSNNLTTIDLEISTAKCCRRNNQNVLKILLAMINDWNVCVSVNYAFKEACRNGHIECAKIMINHGATLLKQGSHLARLNGHFELEKELKTISKKRKFV